MSNDKLSLFNTLTGSVEPVRTIEDGKLRFYSCGPTVYSYAHIGNFRSFLTADLIVRTARALGWEVDYVTNVTDVGHLTDDDLADASGEDRMAKALKSDEGRRFANVYDLARYYTEVLLDDWHSLNLIEPTVRPRATEHIRQQIEAVEHLVEQGIAYETEKGVYFDISRFPDYGKLSGNRDAENLEQAVRDVVQDEEKRNARDFALWKKDPGHLMQWYSPWGWGFPGWHIECSVMSMEYLGEQIDIHAGGEDLIFPHHECEIAQSESISRKTFANHWVHTRFLQVEGEKMSKSKGNFFTVRDLIATPDEGGRGVDPMALRLALISGQYRKPYNFTFETLKASMKHVERLRSAFETARGGLDAADGPDRVGDRLADLRSSMLAAMLDDLNTPSAIAAAIEGAKLIQGLGENLNASSARSALDFLQSASSLLGIPYHDQEAEDPSASASHDPLETRVEELLRQRATARESKDFERADQIREELDEMGIEVMDGPGGSSWRRKTEI
ncbi:MAG: cysteine--tRNA ligase [Rhodothermia bacterium]|nr:cysteine--tRNA ligase [Rhodothermia bacterium]